MRKLAIRLFSYLKRIVSRNKTVRKALVVGIDYYESIPQLYGCVNDSYAVKSVLERHSDGTINFGVNHLTATNSKQRVDRRKLKDTAIELFKDDSEIALFYFAGHGYVENTGGFLIASDSKDGDDGFKLDELLQIANTSPAKNKVIILDSCHSGVAGTLKAIGDNAWLSEGMTILTASDEHQYAMEENNSGVFTTLLVDALNGSAANLVGDITPGSIYAHIDQSLGPWEQRPIFKTNVKTFTTLRKVQPPIELDDLKMIVELFTQPSEEFKLDPSFEPLGDHKKNEENMKKFEILQKYNRINLLVPVSVIHMWNAAMESKSCRLTVLGQHYWNLVKKERI